MKLMKITSFFMLLAAFLFTSPASAMIETNTTTTTTIDKQKKELKKEFKMQKRLSKFEQLVKKAGIDFQDPVEKWLWFGIFAWGAALVLQLSISFWWLSGLLWAAGAVCLVLWVVKKFA